MREGDGRKDGCKEERKMLSPIKEVLEADK